MIMLIFFVFLAGLIFVILHKALDRMYFGPIVLAVLTFVISTMIYSWISEGYIETKEVLKESQKIENQKGWIALKEDHGSKVYTYLANENNTVTAKDVDDCCNDVQVIQEDRDDGELEHYTKEPVKQEWWTFAMLGKDIYKFRIPKGDWLIKITN